MKVFLSWSGPASQDVAAALRKYFPLMLQGVQVFMSQHDLESGSRWANDLASELKEANFGLICLTPDNLLSPWLLFEAGAIAKHLDSRVCALLLKNLSAADVVMPLSQFQNRSFVREDFAALLRDINRKMATPLDTEQLAMVFEKWWPDLEKAYAAVAAKRYHTNESTPRRSDRDLLEEILLRLRDLDVNSAVLSSSSRISQGGDVLARPLGYDSLGWYTLWKFPRLPISEFWQSQLLNDLTPGRYPLVRNIDQVVALAQEAVSAYASEAPALFKHGTDYITKSLGFIDTDFRKAHGFGEQTLRAFSTYTHLVRPSLQQA
jgi:hypothetical protein